jgi:hypothetical protein
MSDSMYYMLECLSPSDGFKALVDYQDDDPLRSWTLGRRFTNSPRIPLLASLRMRKDSKLMEMWKAPLPIISTRFYKVLLSIGIDNIDVFPVELLDSKSGVTYKDYLAFNIIGVIAAADLSKSEYHAWDESKVALDFNSLVIDEIKTRNALIFRLAEATNGIVIHESVKKAIEAAGINTLTFISPEEWVG